MAGKGQARQRRERATSGAARPSQCCIGRSEGIRASLSTVKVRSSTTHGELLSSYGSTSLARAEETPQELLRRHQLAWYEAVKRVLDLLIASLVLLCLWPLWLAIGAAVRFSSPGPVLFRADAVGLRGRPFLCLKFRTMHVDADDSHHRAWIEKYVKENQPYTVRLDDQGRKRRVFKVVDDPRVTSVGRFLRRTGLDEVPQLINVLRGEMSIVGPRPPRVFEYAHYTEYQKRRLDVLPGITGLYQVTARAQASFDEMLRIDLDYISRRSLRLDLAIMARTVPVMLFGHGGF